MLVENEELGNLKATTKPGLSEKNVKDRKIFYKKVKNFGIKKAMLNVGFSDEMPARLCGTINKQNTGVRDVKEKKPILYSFSNKSVTLGIWAFISGKGSSDLYFYDGKTRMNSQEYCKILQFAKEQMDDLGVKYLMEDGAKCHSSANVLQNERNIEN